MKKILCSLAFLMPFYGYAQFSDNFSDSKFFGSPSQSRTVNWAGNTDKFLVNTDLQLQLNAPKETGIAQLRTASSLKSNASWEFWLKMNFNPTSSNYAKVFLYSDKEDLAGSLNGLYVRLGHTNKNLCLISKHGDTETTLISGTAKRLDLNSVVIQVKVSLDKTGKVSLFSKLDGETQYSLDGESSVNETAKPSYFGVVCQYTSTRSASFYFDNFIVKPLDDSGPINNDPGIEKPDSLDVVINEVLFDPPTGGEEYVELYNRSDKAFDLRHLSLATRKSDGSLNTLYPLSKDTAFLDPGNFAVITRNKDTVCHFYDCRGSGVFSELNVTPALNNTGACIVLWNNQDNRIIDEFCYTDKMHAEGITNKKGVALERLSSEKPTNDPFNWHSASAQTNFGTPGYENSQHSTGGQTANEINIVSPDGISSTEYQILYHFKTPGNRANVLIYDLMGRLACRIANNQLLGTEGSLSWNGQGSSGQSLQTGLYILYMEVFDTQGHVRTFKMPVIKK